MTTPDDDARYMVRLVMKVNGKPDEPESAVINFVEMLVQNGMRDWVYRVESEDSTKVLGYFDGYGDPVDMTPPGTTEPDAAPVETSPEQPVESDESLVALAESLNESSEA